MMDNPFTCTLSVEYCDYTFAVAQQNTLFWSTKLDFTGSEMLMTIVMYLRCKHDLLIGKPSAGNILFQIGLVLPMEPEQVRTATGRSLTTGLPGRIEISSIEIREQLKPFLSGFVSALESMLNKPILQENSRQAPSHLLTRTNGLPISMRGEYAPLRLKGLTQYLRNEGGREFVDPPRQ